ncbi:hypothetical protein HZI56_03880 [Lactobacillus salivarius]|nr:hypothetical protein [Ligilactobacillus salivarius]NXZ96435.1 hypothetical protein [Ligilactobacillus salivarius]NYA59725.1 hypothetical protein [Ligilactobacillus salivarius]NYA61875.1 hypothetical protein [Ligilactobacillus salivarius]NYA63114.1 hypothetical protein [Ligilactobacillus salivarius]NYA66297.1 hypothetical protein [Ligilactobacillus salivarius]
MRDIKLVDTLDFFRTDIMTLQRLLFNTVENISINDKEKAFSKDVETMLYLIDKLGEEVIAVDAKEKNNGNVLIDDLSTLSEKIIILYSFLTDTLKQIDSENKDDALTGDIAKTYYLIDQLDKEVSKLAIEISERL